MTEPRRGARSLAWAALVLLGCSAGVDTTSERGAGSIRSLDPAFEAIVPAEAVIERLRGGFVFTEGPVWVADGAGGSLLFSDIPANVVYRFRPPDALLRFIDPVTPPGATAGGTGGSNGLALDAAGRLVLCEHGNRRLSRLEDDGTRTTLAATFEGRRLNSPNDAVVHSDGWIYFTDPPFGLPRFARDPGRELPFAGVYRWAPDRELALVARDLRSPNGIALSPDEKTLYVSNSDRHAMLWLAYDVREDGALGPARVFFNASRHPGAGTPDGMAVDAIGNVFATGPGGVLVITPDGRHLGTIRPDEIPANVAWGDDGRSLYMTAETSLYRIRLQTGAVARR